ncbi:MAG TPA: hypothetical protein PLH72_15605 [Vicinamibacterales bacterium]|nr:hypothetical protein [Vicinamibacterales bacterium]
MMPTPNVNPADYEVILGTMKFPQKAEALIAECEAVTALARWPSESPDDSEQP